MEIADYRGMNTFELIHLINGTASWDDELNEPCMRELCERYNIDFDNYNDEDESIWDYDTLWHLIIKGVYNDVFVHHKYSIDNRDYAIISLDSDDRSEFAVVDEVNHRVMFEVYKIGSMRECKKYIKDRVNNDDWNHLFLCRSSGKTPLDDIRRPAKGPDRHLRPVPERHNWLEEYRDLVLYGPHGETPGRLFDRTGRRKAMRYYKITAVVQYHYRRKVRNNTKEVDEMLQIFDYVQAPGKRYLSKKRVNEILLNDAQFHGPQGFEFLDFEVLEILGVDSLPKDTTATPRLNVFYINGIYNMITEKKNHDVYGEYNVSVYDEFITDKERIWKRL